MKQLLGSLIVNTILFSRVPVLFSQAPAIQWERAYGGTSSDFPKSLVLTRDGGFVIAGQTRSTNGDVKGFHQPTGLFDFDAWILKLASDGAIQWQKAMGGTGDDAIYSL